MTTSPPSFEQLALAHPVLKAVKEVGYETPSPIQAESIPHLLNGCDFIGQAQTGTGKTAAFALPLLSRIEVHDVQPQVLVLTPTRELAIQVAEAFQTYARHLKGFHVTPIYGGQSMHTQLRQLKRGVHVVIGTPGRVMDHIRRQSLSLASLKSIVLDEADEMLKMGFIDDVEWILERTPQQRQIALFSATMPPAIRKVAQKHLRNPQEIKIKQTTATVAAIEQYYWQVSGVHKLDALTRILETEDFDAAIVFVRTKTETAQLAEKLEARGFAAAAINGDMNQTQRERTIEQLKAEKLDIVVATDVAARGLDVKRITHVINYDIPNDTEAYVHRIGRTGRAGRTGKAILFVAPREMRMLRTIEKATKQTIARMQLPSGESVTLQRVAQFKQNILETVESENLQFFYQVLDQLQEAQALELKDIAAALAYITQRDRPLQVKTTDTKVKTHDKRTKQKPEQTPPRNRKAQESGEKVEMLRYRIEVGHNLGATPRDIVGAIANEAGLDSRYIGRIDIQDNYSIVELPTGMPKATFYHLKQARVRQHKMDISVVSDTQPVKAEKHSGKKKRTKTGKRNKPTKRKMSTQS
jgi:ATP-dependent RNA helicase DeaD